MTKLKASIYTDGSYKPNEYIIGCAILICSNKAKRPLRIVYSKLLKTQRKYGSNIAEISAVKTAIKIAISHGFSEVDIFHDWTGIEWYSHSENIKKHHIQCPTFANYAKYTERARKIIKINFIKVKAHSDNQFNCYVDKMAKSGKILDLCE